MSSVFHSFSTPTMTVGIILAGVVILVLIFVILYLANRDSAADTVRSPS